MATIKDIAKRLNISVSTVSYALNGGPRTVPEAVKERVWAVARELDYRPNRVARQLVTRTSDTIGIATDHPAVDAMLGPFLQNVFNSVLNVAERSGQDVLFLTSHSGADARTYVNTLLDGRVDGVLLLAAKPQSELVSMLRERDFPHVLISAPEDAGSPSFGVDNDASIRVLVRHLVELGHRRIGFVRGLERQPDSQFREMAVLEEFEAHGVETRPEWQATGEFTAEQGYRAGLQILSRSDRPGAVMAFNDESAIGVINAARELGLRVPEDLSVTGFDNIPWIQFVRPGLTTMRQPVREIAAAAAEALLEKISGKPVIGRLFDAELIVRESTRSPLED